MRTRLNLLLPAAMLTLASPALAADWTPLPPLAEPRMSAASASLAGGVHVVGGRGSSDLASHEVLVPGGPWAFASGLPESRVGAALATSPGAMWIAGGFDPFGVTTPDVRSWDVTSGSWLAGPPLPEGRAAFGMVALGNTLVVAGGEGDFGMAHSNAWKLDPGAPDWSAIAPLPTPRSGVAAVAFAGRMWVIGGAAPDPLATVEAWNPATNAWATLAPLPAPLWQPAAAVVADRVWVVGGVDGTFQPSTRVFSAASDGAWRAETALPAALAAATASGVGELLVVAGGQDASGNPVGLVWGMNAGSTPPPPPPPPGGEPLAVTVELNPTTLNRTSNGRWVNATIEASGRGVETIVLSSVRLNEMPADLEAGHSFADQDNDGNLELSLRFAREGLALALSDGDHVLPFTGTTGDGGAVTGEATLRVVGGEGNPKRGAGRHVAASTMPGRARIAFTLEKSSEVTVEVLDLMGRSVERIVDRGFLTAGTHEREWPAAGSPARSGVYFVRVRATGLDETVRIPLTR